MVNSAQAFEGNTGLEHGNYSAAEVQTANIHADRCLVQCPTLLHVVNSVQNVKNENHQNFTSATFALKKVSVNSKVCLFLLCHTVCL